MGAIAAAVVFTWLGMVLAISFLEAPVKFRVPGITLQLGLGIGRLVYGALNTVEMGLAILLMSAATAASPGRAALAAVGVAVAMLATQVVVVRPRLRRRSDAVLASAERPPDGMLHRSHAHFVYAGLEVVKVMALLIAGVFLQVSALYP